MIETHVHTLCVWRAFVPAVNPPLQHAVRQEEEWFAPLIGITTVPSEPAGARGWLLPPHPMGPRWAAGQAGE